jgi:phage shock protein A
MENTKSFWKKPEGPVGGVLMAAIAIAGGYFFYQALPTLLKMAQDTLKLGFMVGIIAVVAWAVTNERIRTTVWYLFKSLARLITSAAIELDPIAIMKSYIEDLKDKQKKIMKGLTELIQQEQSLILKKDEEDARARDWENKAKMAQRNGDDVRAKAFATNMAKSMEYSKKLGTLIAKIGFIKKVLSKISDSTSIYIETTTNEVRIREDEYNTYKKSNSIMKTAFSIISGDGTKKEIFDEAWEVSIEQMGASIGEIESMIQASNSFISSIDYQNATWQEDGLAVLEKIEKTGLNLVGGSSDELIDINQIKSQPQPVLLTRDSKKSGHNSDLSSLL